MLLEVLIFGFLVAGVWHFTGKRSNFPPGPPGLPILGHLPLLGTSPHKTLIKWRRKYGPLIGIHFGSYRTVVIHDLKLIKEALSMNSFSGRPRINLFTMKCGGDLKGIMLNDGQFAQDQRKFTIKNLKDVGVRSKTMEENIQFEVKELLQEFKAAGSKPVNIHRIFNIAAINSLWSIMFSERLKQDDPEVAHVIHGIATICQETDILTSLAILVPWLSKIAPNLTGYNSLAQKHNGISEFFQRSIDRHNESYIQGQPRDFIDLYMDEVNRVKNDTTSSFHPMHQQMVHTVYDLFSASTESTSTILQWTCAYAIHHPDSQMKLQKEIDQVVGKDRTPSLADRPDMNYTEAFMSEVLRFSSVTFFGLFHNTMEDVEFHGYFIPKDTMIIPNLYSCQYDPQVWGDPGNFRPERFLDERGMYKKNEHLIAFSTGKRACLGETLGRNSLFLFTTGLFQKFTLHAAAGKLPNLNPKVSFVLAPQPFEVVFEERRAI